jgi:hypothetical protein
MDTRIELNHTHSNGEGGWKNADGVIYTINDDGTTASAHGKEITTPNIVIANEVAIDGNVYPVNHVTGFYYSEILKSLYLPTNIKVIGGQLCQECNLESLTIQGGIEEIKPYAFYRAQIQNVTLIGSIGGNFIKDLKIENLYLDSLEVLLSINDKSDVKNIYIDGGLVEDLVIPEGVTEIPESFVSGCESIKIVTLPSTIKTIGYGAFTDCKNLSSINFPDGLEQIGRFAFCGCSSLNNIELPKSISQISDNAFSGTTIEQVVIPEGAKIDYSIFSDCKNLKAVQLPEGLTTIPRWAFKNCESLTSINIPSSVKRIKEYAFSRCQIAELHLPDQLEYIGEFAFAHLPITELTIPAAVAEIGKGAFEGCDKLCKVYSKIEDPSKCDVKTLDSSAEGFYKQATLVVPNIKGIVSAYKKKAAWKKFSAIVMED